MQVLAFFASPIYQLFWGYDLPVWLTAYIKAYLAMLVTCHTYKFCRLQLYPPYI